MEKDEYEHVHIPKSIKLCSLSQCVDEKDMNVLIFISCFVHNVNIIPIATISIDWIVSSWYFLY